jgi:hypothetical protein
MLTTHLECLKGVPPALVGSGPSKHPVVGDRSYDRAIDLAGAQGLDEPFREEIEALAASHCTHARGRQDQPPARASRMQARQDVRWKHWSRHDIAASGVSNAFDEHRTISDELLPGEILNGEPFLVRMRVNHDPGGESAGLGS